MRLCVHDVMGSSSFVISLYFHDVGLMKAFFTLRGGAVIAVTLVDGGMSDSVHGGGIDYIIGTLRDVCVLSSFSICVKNGVVQ